MEKVKSTTQLEFGTRVKFDTYVYRLMDSNHLKTWYPIPPRRDKYKYAVPIFSSLGMGIATMPEMPKPTGSGEVAWMEYTSDTSWVGILIGYAKKANGKAVRGYHDTIFGDGDEPGYMDNYGKRYSIFAEVACRGSSSAVLFLVPPDKLEAV